VRRDVAGCDHAGRELPVQDYTRLHMRGGSVVGVACPEVYGLDALPHRLRLTLLRSPLMAHMDLNPALGTDPRAVVAAQGVHEFRLRFFAGDAASPPNLDLQASMLHRPLVIADLTRGMKAE